MTSALTDAQVAEIRGRADKATLPPWMECKDGNCTCGYIFGDRGVAYVAKVLSLDDDVDPVAKPEQMVANATFIAHAREDVPALLSALLACRERADRLTEALRTAPRPLPETFDLVVYMDWYFQQRDRAMKGSPDGK